MTAVAVPLRGLDHSPAAGVCMRAGEGGESVRVGQKCEVSSKIAADLYYYVGLFS